MPVIDAYMAMTAVFPIMIPALRLRDATGAMVEMDEFSPMAVDELDAILARGPEGRDLQSVGAVTRR